MKLPRWMHKLRANLTGYFWLPCPLCGEMFGGHEWDGESIIIAQHKGVGVCPNCRGAARQHNRKWMDEHPGALIYKIDSRYFAPASRIL